MDLIDKFKQNLNSAGADEPINTGPIGGSSAAATDGGDIITTGSNTWNTFVESMDSARKRASVIFTIPEADAAAAAEPAQESAFTGTLKGWWSDASAFLEETRISVEEKISEMTGPSQIKNDSLSKLRMALSEYTESLEQLRTEAFNLGMTAENMGRLGAAPLGKCIADVFGESSPLKDQFDVYKDKHTKLVVPLLDEVRLGVEQITAMVTEDITNIQAIQTRFKRRDRLHQSLVDMRSRVDLKREKNNRRVADGMQVDSKSMEELYELTRAMDSIESDFRITSEQLVAKCNELLGAKSAKFHSIFLKLVETQNAFFYRVGGSCSIPFQELYEAMRADKPGPDDPIVLGDRPLTWRGEFSSGAVENPTTTVNKMPLSRLNTVNISKLDAGAPTETAVAGSDSQTNPTYRRDRSGSFRRAGTSSALLD